MRHSQKFVIDDDLDVLSHRAVLLRRAGFDPICFSSATAALGHDKFAQADLVICDLYSRRVSPAHRSIAGSRTDHERRRHRWAAGRRRRLSEKARNPADVIDVARRTLSEGNLNHFPPHATAHDRLFRMQDVRDPLTRLERLSS